MGRPDHVPGPTRLNDFPAHGIVKLGIAQSPEGRKIFPRLTVLENLQMGAYTRGNPAEVQASLERAFNLLLVDCERGLGNRRTVPLGGLREPPSHARFADGMVVTKCPDAAAGEAVARSVPFPAGRPGRWP